MNNEEKLEKSTAVGSLTLFVSCYGINIYEVATHDGYTNYQDKLPFESVLVTSIVTGIIMTIVTWLVLTLYDCHKKAKEDDSVTTLELFNREVFCKRTFIGLVILIIASFLVIFLGIIFLSLIVFYIFILKGKTNLRK